jgi:hypothetical protein
MIEVLSSFGTYPQMRRLVHRVLLVIDLVLPPSNAPAYSARALRTAR